ncbi:MAG: hypothetical protein JNK65_02920, partial [Deltaproteobacteria bacterium]|nr:hypothetical protein [Deltaproteobacteria bacterium]
ALEQELIEAKNKILNLENKLAYEKSETSQPHLAKETSLEEKDITLNDKKIEQSLYRSDWTWQKLEEAYFAYMLIKYKRDYPAIAEAMGVGIATVYVKLRKFGFKNDLKGWEETKSEHIGMSLENYKAQVIRDCYEQNDKSPYATAKQLNLNIGTIYRFLKSDSPDQ